MKSHQEMAACYRPDIDGLRAIAVLSVVLYHAGLPGFSGGFVGVDIFFVISGYLISGLVWRDLERGQFSLADFYARRIRRIFPALCAVLALSAVAAYVLLIPSDLVEMGKSLQAAVLFYSNFQLLKEVGYFAAPAADKPLLHTWSLSVEEQFYAIWPLLLLAMARVLPARRVLPAILVLAAVSLLLAQLKLALHPKDAFYVSYYRMWELLTGAALAVAAPFFLKSRVAALIAMGGLGAIAYPVFFYDSSTSFPGLRAAVPCVGAALVIAAGGFANPISAVLGLRPFRFIGLISYSLYLIHWPVLSFAHLFLNDVLNVPQRMAIVGLSIALSYVSWRYIETPFRLSAPSHARTFFRGAAVATALCAVGVAFVSGGGFPSRVSGKFLSAEGLTDKFNAEFRSICRSVTVDGIEGTVPCILGDPAKTAYDFLLWGDSHAWHYIPAIDALAKANKASGMVLEVGGCAPLLDVGEPACREFNKSVLNWVTKQHSLRLVILASRWTTSKRDFEYALSRQSFGDDRLLSGVIARLAKLQVSTVILGQVPEFKQGVLSCIARAAFYERDPGSCSLASAAEIAKRYAPMSAYFAALKKRYPLTVVNPLPAFCDAEWCHAIDRGEVLMRDENHLTVAGAMHALPYLQIPGLPSRAETRENVNAVTEALPQSHEKGSRVIQ